jgi:hypothetical protein
MKKFVRDIVLIIFLFTSILAFSNWSTLKEILPDLAPSKGDATSETPEAISVAHRDREEAGINASEEEKRICPSNWIIAPTTTYKKIGEIFEMQGVDTKNDKPLLGEEHAKLQANVVGTISGGGITLGISPSSYVIVDGKHIIGVSVFKMENAKDSVINILAPGLATVTNKQVTITSDSDSNIVYLDGCLDWQNPSNVTRDGKRFIRYTARDKDGREASVDVSERIQVRVLPPRRIADWLQASLSPPTVEKDNTEGSQVEKPRRVNLSEIRESITVVDLTTKLTHEQALELYQRMVDALPEKTKHTFQFLIDLMKKGRMPVFYPGAKVVGGQYFETLQFNPKGVVTLTTQDFKECGKRSWNSNTRADWVEDCLSKGQCPPITETGVIIGNDDGNKISCFSGNFLHLLGNGTNEVQHSYGSSIIQSGSGDDSIKIGGETTILVFQKNWGKDTVEQESSHGKWLDVIKDSPAKEEWNKAGFKHQHFMVFGPGIFPQDLQWESHDRDPKSGLAPRVLRNAKTGDTITFKRWPNYNFIFYEEGKFESYSEFDERDDKRRTEAARQRIEDLKIPQRYGERLKSCGSEKNCYLSLARDVAKDIDDARKKCEIESSIVMAKFKADGSISVQDAISFATGVTSPPLEVETDKPDTCKYDNVQLALGLAKSGKTEEALKLVLTEGKVSRSRAITGQTKVVTEVMRGFIEKKKVSAALDLAIEFLQEHYAAASADLLLVVDPDFYKLTAGLDYSEKLKANLPLQAEFFANNKEAKNQAEKLFRLLLIVAFDDKHFSKFDEFIPSAIGADTKHALYFMIAAQMVYAKKEDQLTFFLKRGIDESGNVSSLERVRRVVGNTYLPLTLGDRKELVYKMAHLLNTSPDALYTLSVVWEGSQALKEKNIEKAESFLHKANTLMAQLVMSRIYITDVKQPHRYLTKQLVEHILLENLDIEKAKSIFIESQNANSTIKDDEFSSLLSAFYAREDIEKAFSNATKVSDSKERLRAYQAIASNAELKSDKKTLEKALEKAGEIFKNLPEAEKTFHLWNMHMSALSKDNRTYALAELMVSLGDLKHQDAAYEKIALSAARDKQVSRAMRNAALIKSEEARALALSGIAQELASNGLTEEALKLRPPDDRPRLEIVKQWSATRPADAAALASTMKDPHIFAQAVLVLGDSVKQ